MYLSVPTVPRTSTGRHWSYWLDLHKKQAQTGDEIIPLHMDS